MLNRLAKLTESVIGGLGPTDLSRRSMMITAATSTILLASCRSPEEVDAALLQEANELKKVDLVKAMQQYSEMNNPPLEEVHDCVERMQKIPYWYTQKKLATLYYMHGTNEQCFEFANKLTSTNLRTCRYRASLYTRIGDVQSLEKLREIHVKYGSAIRRQGSDLDRKIVNSIEKIEDQLNKSTSPPPQVAPAPQHSAAPSQPALQH